MLVRVTFPFAFILTPDWASLAVNHQVYGRKNGAQPVPGSTRRRLLAKEKQADLDSMPEEGLNPRDPPDSPPGLRRLRPPPGSTPDFSRLTSQSVAMGDKTTLSAFNLVYFPPRKHS